MGVLEDHNRFAVAPRDMDDPLFTGSAEWEFRRVLYFQNSSDPIPYFEPSLRGGPQSCRPKAGPKMTPMISATSSIGGPTYAIARMRPPADESDLRWNWGVAAGCDPFDPKYSRSLNHY